MRSALHAQSPNQSNRCLPPFVDLGNEPGPLVTARSIDEAQMILTGQRVLELNSALRIAGTELSVTHPISSLWTLYRAGPAISTRISEYRSTWTGGVSAPKPIDMALLLAGILVDPLQMATARRSWDIALSAARVSFARNGYAVLRDLIPPLLCGALRRQYRCMVKSGAMRLGDGQSPLRYVAHNEAMARFVHQQVLQTMCAIAGVNVKPSYVYAACYSRGASLPRHVDRKQCEYSISLSVDYAPEIDGPAPWPLWLDTASGPIAIYQSLGDALFYRGCMLPHFRSQLTLGDFSTSLLLHYVDENFRGPLN